MKEIKTQDLSEALKLKIMKLSLYLKINVDELVIALYYLFRCKVCDTPLIFSFDDIDRHVKERHSLTLEDYEINYNAFECTDKKGGLTGGLNHLFRRIIFSIHGHCK